MFISLISDQFENANEVANPCSGVIVANLLSRSLTGEAKTDHYIWSPRRAAAAMAQIDKNRPTIIDVEHIDWRENRGRLTLETALQIFQQITQFSNQTGFARSWPGCSKLIGDLTEEHLVDIIKMPYQQNRYGKPHILPKVQFLVAWAHPFSASWEEWEKVARFSLSVLRNYYKPVYADITLSFHPSSKTMRGKPITAEQLAWMIYRLYALKYDGVIIRDQYEISLNKDFKESLMSTLNQINEQH